MDDKLTELKDEIIAMKWEIAKAGPGIKREYVLEKLKSFLEKINWIENYRGTKE